MATDPLYCDDLTTYTNFNGSGNSLESVDTGSWTPFSGSVKFSVTGGELRGGSANPGVFYIFFHDDSVIPVGATINTVELQVYAFLDAGTLNIASGFVTYNYDNTHTGAVSYTGDTLLTDSVKLFTSGALATRPGTGLAWTRANLFATDATGLNISNVWKFSFDGSGSVPNVNIIQLIVDYTDGGGSTPTLVSLDVSTGPVSGNTDVTVTGTNFDLCTHPQIFIGGTLVPTTYVSATTLTFKTPAFSDVNLSDPILDVTLRCGGSVVSTLSDAWTWTRAWFEFDVPDNFDLGLDIEPFHFYGYGYPDLLDLDWLRLTLGFTLEDWRRLLIRFPTFTWWTPSTTPDTHGWYYSTANFGGDVYVVDSTDRPVNPRKWSQIATFATGATNMLGGSPGAAAVKNNRLYYAAGNYTTSTDLPPIRILKGGSDYQLATVPKTDSGGVPYTIISMLAANDTIYVATIDSGSSSADWLGRVFEFDTKSGQMTKIGATFPTGHIPYALEFHNGRLWVGTHKQTAGGVGRVYYFRPGIDTDWTLDLTLASGNVASMRGFQGQLYIGTTNAAASRGLVRQRTTAGVWSTVQTGSGGTAKDGNGYIALTEFSDKLYASYWNDDTTPVSKIEKSSDGSSWSTSYTGASGTNRPFIGLVSDNSYLFAVGGGTARTAALVRTPDGTTWTNLTGFLPDTTETFVPVFGVMVR
jgi:hypothetical protein